MRKYEPNLLIKQKNVNLHKLPLVARHSDLQRNPEESYYRLRTMTGLQISNKCMGWNHFSRLFCKEGEGSNHVTL